MKVVRIIARLNVGGPARHVVWLASGLPEYETMLVAGTVAPGEDDMSYFAAEAGVVPHVIPEMSREISLQDALTVWKLYRLFVRERPDIVHTHTAKAGTVGRTAGMLYRWFTPCALIGRPRPCRFVHTYHGHIFHSYYNALKTRIFLLIEKFLARVATDRIIVISPQQYREIHEEFGVGRAEQFAIIPLGIETSMFADWHKRRHVLRDELGAGERDVLIGIVGRLTEIKNHEMFLRAAAKYLETRGRSIAANNISDSAGRVRFVVIGDGQLRGELEGRARALGVERDVIFLGTRNDPENFYPALDIVALTSRNEGTPLTLIEALANARAVVATRVGGVADLLGKSFAAHRDGDAFVDTIALCERGVLVRPDDVDGFCEGLARLVGDETLRREMGERGENFVRQHYSKERLLADVSNLYHMLLAHAPRSACAAIKPTLSKEANASIERRS